MIIKIKGFGDNLYKIAAGDIVATYVKLSFWLSPFAFWKLYEIAIEVMK